MKKGLKNNQGFTMIELIVVIVIIGILAAIAVPKYLDLRSSAEVAALAGITGALRAAASLSYANCMVNNTVPSDAKVLAQLEDTSGLAGASPWSKTIGSHTCTWTFVAPASITAVCP
jgi:prepilin-type N-terminal cleavage/methylation domain-containing protein